MIEERKRRHLEVCQTEQVERLGLSTLLEEVSLIHQALPELAVDELDLSTSLLGHTLRIPLIISSMSGGVDEALSLNRDLARLAQAKGLAMGLGSVRPLLEEKADATTYLLRDVAPSALMMANLGLVQAIQAPLSRIQSLMGELSCNALILHLNPAQELMQPQGDWDFRGALEGLVRLVEGLEQPIIIKETGCGLSREAAQALVQCGVQVLDVAGAGGTSWIHVEAKRHPEQADLAEQFTNWGVPTAASLLALSDLPLTLVASGGVRNGMDAARAMALGATAVGMALPFLKAWSAGGYAALEDLVDQFEASLRMACLLSGARRVQELRTCPRHIGLELRAWSRDLGYQGAFNPSEQEKK